MDWVVHKLWLIPALPLVAAALSAVLKQRRRGLAASLAIGAMVLALWFVLPGAGERSWTPDPRHACAASGEFLLVAVRRSAG